MTTIKQLLCLLLLSSAGLGAQSLNIKGKFHNKAGEKLNVHYVLCAGLDTVLTGSDDKLKSKLALNRDYFLTISLDGYQSKTVWFATHTNLTETFTFEFDVQLDREPRRKMTEMTISALQQSHGALVFFDEEKGTFDYTRN
jgi:hypothetical protein